MMTEKQQQKAAKKFTEDWMPKKGYEKGEAQSFWLDLLQNVYGVRNPYQFISFEDQVKLKHTSFMDGYIAETKVMIEQKSKGVDLAKAELQSDGSMLTPFEQAKRYSNELGLSKKPRYIVVCNFETFHVHDMEHPQSDPQVIHLADLPKEYHRLAFLTDVNKAHLKREMDLSVKAGEIVGKIYDAILKHYHNQSAESTLKSLNMLCVRLVFCLYAEDAGIFVKDQFHDYLAQFEAKQLRNALINLFKVLDTKEEERDPYLDDDLAAFPYVNGGLFAETELEIPQFDDTIKELLLAKASDDFNWSEISPTIFGAVFESTLNPETRRSGGMHYTSIENIHKVIDPLFLDDLKTELEEILSLKAVATRNKKLSAFQNKIASLTFLDPACGSGNFLTETYLSLRKLENKCLEVINAGQTVLGFDDVIKVSIGQFYGIEINDFAVTVAKTALWIAESQMMKATEDIVHMDLDFLPLKSYANIIEANALRIDWNSVIPKEKLNYIMGNPPFVGGMYMNEEQKKDISNIFPGVNGVGEMDYVCAWYKKAADIIKKTKIKSAFVSTNSICQGQQVITFWKYIFQNYNLQIDYAYETFIWNNDANEHAKVHCVIVGFSEINNVEKARKLYDTNNNYKLCKNISPYLTDSSTVFIESRSTPICNISPIKFGSMPRDGGGFIFSEEEKVELVSQEPIAEKWIRNYIGAVEFLNNKKRYCLWLVNADPSEIKKCPTVLKRITAVRDFRAASKAAGTRKFAETPTIFCQIAQPDSDYIIVPKTSSGKRSYIPLGFMDKNTIASDLVFLIPGGSLYEFGVLCSQIHNAWVRVVAGRLKSDYRYSKDIVYNNFPWCMPTDAQKAAIEKTAQAILDARALYPDCSLADLYDEATMPPELRKAHQTNDKAVMKAYGYAPSITEPEIVADLMKRYQELTTKEK